MENDPTLTIYVNNLHLKSNSKVILNSQILKLDFSDSTPFIWPRKFQEKSSYEFSIHITKEEEEAKKIFQCSQVIPCKVSYNCLELFFIKYICVGYKDEKCMKHFIHISQWSYERIFIMTWISRQKIKIFFPSMKDVISHLWI